MKKEEFVYKLKELRPSRESFLKLGYPPELVDRRLESYVCIDRRTTNVNYSTKSEVLSLLCNYNCSFVEVGVVKLFEKIEEFEQFFVIGEVETDKLALNKQSLEIEVLDHLNLEWVIWPCAADGEKLLDALIAAATLFSERISNPELATNSAYTYTHLLICSDKAGGKKYIDFFKMLLGYDF